MAGHTDRDARLEGNWQEMRGRLREAWGALTDDDVDRARGSWERLVGTIRQQTGETLSRVETKLNEILDAVEESGRPDR